MLVHNLVVTGSLTFPTALPISGSLLVSGSTTFNGTSTFSSPDLATDGLGNVNIFTTDAAAIGKGGSLSFGGGTTGGTSPYAFAKIEGVYDGSAAYDGTLIFSTNRAGTIAEKMRISNSGSVGIGTTVLGWDDALITALQVRNSSFYGYSTNELGIVCNAQVQGGWKYISTGAASYQVSAGGGHAFYTAPSGNASASVTWTERLAIANNGGVTVNGLASSVTYKLGVSGSAYINGSNNKGIFVTDNATYASIVGLNSAISTYNALEIRASSTDYQLYLTTGGNVGIANSGYSNYRVNIRGSDTTSSNFTFRAEDSGTNTLFECRNDGLIRAGLQTYSPYNFSLTGRNCYINSSGEFGYLSSTRESKANIESIKSIDFINQLNPVRFNYRKKNSETNEYTDELYDNINYGFIADEVEKVNKDLVFYKSDGITLAGVEYNNMIAILTKAIQEQQTTIETLTTRITALEN